MALLELHKMADKSGPPPEDGQPWPLSHVELVSGPPSAHIFSDDFVVAAVKEGWMEYTGESVSYEVQPDPQNKNTMFLGSQTVTLPGDRLVLHLERDGKKVDVTYKIVTGPVPRDYRVEDADDPTGFSAKHSFAVELVT